MKNLLIYINPDKKFTPEHETLTKIQIDNSLALGWATTDIILVCNFDYEYRGIRSTIVKDYEALDQHRSTKIFAINQLFSDGLITNDIYWFHDHDAFQLEHINLELNVDAAFTDHGDYSKTWNAGSFFFNQNAKSIFESIAKYMEINHSNEQNALTYMWDRNIDNINKRFILIDPSYNVGIYKIEENLKKAGTNMKVAHFHPHKKHHLQLFRKYLPQSLLTIFETYGIK